MGYYSPTPLRISDGVGVMPLSRRQFELGIDEESEQWMRQAYRLLSDNSDLAYSAAELYKEVVGESPDLSNKKKFDHTLFILGEIGGIDVRVLDGSHYFAFLEELDTADWVKKVYRF